MSTNKITDYIRKLREQILSHIRMNKNIIAKNFFNITKNTRHIMVDKSKKYHTTDGPERF